MNKKLLYGMVLPLLAVVLVSAGILLYYANVLVTLNIDQQININGEVPYEIPQTINCEAGEFCVGDALEISNSGASDKIVTISGIGCGEESDLSFVGKLIMSKKNTETWETMGEPIELVYTLVGDSFEARGIPEGYTLIYYKDVVVGLDGRLENPQPAILIHSGIGELPQWDDANLDAEYSQAPDYYDHEIGAKLWMVPEGAIEGNTLDWSQWDNFYYETDLIYSFANNGGWITIPAGSFITVYPAFDVDELAYDTCEATITIV